MKTLMRLLYLGIVVLGSLDRHDTYDSKPITSKMSYDGPSCNSPIFVRFILLFICVCYMCSYVINCLCVYFWLGFVEFGVRRVF
jgi:hypothetical protein